MKKAGVSVACLLSDVPKLLKAKMQKEVVDQAIACRQKAVEIKPDKIESCYNMGIMYYRTNEFDKLVECCEKALEIIPSSTEILRLMSAVKKKKEQN